MDALSDVLRVMRLKGGVFLHGAFRGPWCLSVTVEPENCAPFLGETAHVIPYHFLLEGRMGVRMSNGEELQLEPGESVLFPRNDPHLLGNDLDRPPVPGDEVVQPPADGGLLTISLGEDGPPPGSSAAFSASRTFGETLSSARCPPRCVSMPGKAARPTGSAAPSSLPPGGSPRAAWARRRS